MRNWELAHALSNHCEVTLAVPDNSDITSERVHILPFELEGGDLRIDAQKSDVIILNGFVLHFHPYLAEMNIPIAIDLYVPSLLEGLVWHDKDDWGTWIPSYEEYLSEHDDEEVQTWPSNQFIKALRSKQNGYHMYFRNFRECEVLTTTMGVGVGLLWCEGERGRQFISLLN